MNAAISPARIERSLRQRLLTAYRRDLPTPPERIVVGFSGGPDSLALAILLVGIARAIPSQVQLLHVDHRIRSESVGDLQRCQELASALGLPLASVRLADHPLVLHPGVGLEEAARRARYQAFSEAAGERDVVALAHQSGDQAETVLLHLMHGSGLRGLAGMRSTAEIPVPWWTQLGAAVEHLRLWRPLLAEHRDDLLAVIEHHGLSPLLDPSNDDLSLKRNAVRHHALPALREIEPSIDVHLGTLARILADEDDLLSEQADQALSDARLRCGGLATERLCHLHVAMARRVVRRWLEEGQGLTPTFDRVEALLGLARSRDQAAQVDVGEGLLAGCFGNALHCGTLRDLQHLAWCDARLSLPLAGSCTVPRVTGDTITVHDASYQEERGAARRLSSTGEIGLLPVRLAERGAGTERWSEWLRRERISPWIRDRVQGVAVGGDMWWIPRQGDYDEADGDRLVRIIWSDQERN